jgi:hypothetical protein
MLHPIRCSRANSRVSETTLLSSGPRSTQIGCGVFNLAEYLECWVENSQAGIRCWFNRRASIGLACRDPSNSPLPYLDHTATVVSIVVVLLRIDHLFSPSGTMVKQLGFACCHVVQNPVLLSFHLPPVGVPDCATGSRITFPSDVKVILNLVPLGVEAVKGWPLKKVA